VHPKVGELRVRDLLQEWVHHDRNHTRQLLAIQQERVYPHMGNSQKFVGE
jgi:predicted nucleic acid-binding Zn ribbon protein